MIILGPKGPRGAPWAPGAPSPLRWVGSKNEPPTENCTFWKNGAPWVPWAPENGGPWAPWAPQAPRAPWGMVILATRMIILTTRMIILMLYDRPALRAPRAVNPQPQWSGAPGPSLGPGCPVHLLVYAWKIVSHQRQALEQIPQFVQVHTHTQSTE